MNCKTNVARVFAAVAAIGCFCVALPAPAQVPTGPITPLKKIDFKTVDPLGGAKLPSSSPVGAAGRTIVGRKAGSNYYPDGAASQGTGVSGGGPSYNCPGTARQPIRAGGGFTGYSDAGNRRGAQKAWNGNSVDVKNMYR